MMDRNAAWIDNSDGDLLQFDFHPPTHWTRAQVVSEQMACVARLQDPDPEPDTALPGWLALARRLPEALRVALVAELRAGNQLTGIGSTGWPNDGSIVVNLRERFSTARQALPPGVAWREPDDPHYAREEMSQKDGAVEFLLIT